MPARLSFWQLFCVLWGGVHKGSNARKCRIKHIQLYRLEKVGLKALLDSSQPKFQEELEIPRFGCLPKPLQNQTVWWSLWALFCVLWGGVHKGSNIRKCRFKHIQLYRLEKVGLKAFLDSSLPIVPGMSWNPKVWIPSQTIANRTRRCIKLNH